MTEWDNDRIKRFWEARGWHWWEDGQCWAYGESGISRELPDIHDLNALFRYAVPKLQDRGYGFVLTDSQSKPPFWCELYCSDTSHEVPSVVVANEDMALCLAEAIEKVLK